MQHYKKNGTQRQKLLPLINCLYIQALMAYKLLAAIIGHNDSHDRKCRVRPIDDQ